MLSISNIESLVGKGEECGSLIDFIKAVIGGR
jgi:hypothetical protein